MRAAFYPLVALAAMSACAGKNQPDPRTTPPPAYTTSGPSTDEHVMPDGTVMKGAQHPGHDLTTPDAGSSQGHEHHEGATHVMPDGTVMPGASHGTPP